MGFVFDIDDIEKQKSLHVNHGAKAVTETMNIRNYSTEKKQAMRKLIQCCKTHGREKTIVAISEEKYR